MTCIWLGIETDEQGRICTATLPGERPWIHGKTIRYRNLKEFEDAWKAEFDGWQHDFSVALDYYEYVRKPSPIVDWLTTRRDIAIEYFNFPGIYPYFEAEVAEIPDTFHKAYILAMCAYHRGMAFRTAKELLLEVYGLQRRLQRLEEGLNRLAYTIPPPRNEPKALYCPF
jgi:hypothetical protein